jgi:hypothetical protein
MTRVRRFVFVALASCIVPLPATVRAQSASAAGAKLPLNAVLVLTPDCCATKFKQGSMWTTGRETLAVRNAACSELAPARKPAFATLTVAKASPISGHAHVVLIPQFVSAHAATSALSYSNRETDVFLQWTVKDAAGRTVWLQTVRGTSKHHVGNALTVYRDVKLIVRDSVKSVAAQSAASMEAAPELRRLAATSTTAEK